MYRKDTLHACKKARGEERTYVKAPKEAHKSPQESPQRIQASGIRLAGTPTTTSQHRCDANTQPKPQSTGKDDAQGIRKGTRKPVRTSTASRYFDFGAGCTPPILGGALKQHPVSLQPTIIQPTWNSAIMESRHHAKSDGETVLGRKKKLGRERSGLK